MTAEPTKTDVVPQNSIVRSNSGVHDPTGGVPLGPPLKPTDLGSLGPYRVVRAVGRGGMGMVFLGVDPKLRRKIALKVMLPKYLARPSARERFLREARALAAVRNDHVVNIYQVDEASGVPYLALEYLQGCTLEDYLRDGQPLSLVQLLHVAREVAIGLAAAHDHNVIHRDVKPENIWLEAPNGRVKLIDFGLARLPTHPTQSTLDGSVIGTPAYMSPEQARGLEIDARSDLFSLGSVLYRLLAGRPPFSGDTPYFQVVALTGQPHTPLSKINPDLPDNLIALVDALLQKDPAKRPATARELAKELKRIETQVRHPDQMQNSDGAMSRPLSPTAIPVVNTAAAAWAGLDTETSTATPSNGSRIAPPPRPKPFWLWAYFIGTLGLAVLVALLILRFG